VPKPPAAPVLRFARLFRPQGTRRADSAPRAPVAFSAFCVFETALPDPFCAEPACGASAALRALVSAPKVRYAQIQHISATLAFSAFSICCVLSTPLSGLFCTEPACGASAELRAVVPAHKT
jgi:hypothetical protein